MKQNHIREQDPLKQGLKLHNENGTVFLNTNS